MKEKYRDLILFVIALGLGILIGWIDSRPTWDDTGITVAMLMGVSVLLGFISPKRPWIWALSVGIWVSIWNILLNSNYESLLALPVSFFGAYVGSFGRKIFFTIN